VTPDLAKARTRLVIMLVACTACLVAAGGFAAGYFVYNIGWMFAAFIVALVAGFAAQIWFIAGFARPSKGA
jgi:hypothetical protein